MLSLTLAFFYSYLRWPLVGIAAVILQRRLFFFTQFGEPRISGWLFLFTHHDTTIISLFLTCFFLCAYYKKLKFSSLIFLCLTLDITHASLFVPTNGFFPAPPEASLLNGFLFIHPPILYISFGFLWLFFFLMLKSRCCLRRRSRYNPFAKLGFSWTITALLLGALWAQQELNWGGWWSWDLVEAGTLLLIFNFLLFLHFHRWSYSLISISYVNIKLFLFFFCSLRYGFFESIHSFLNVSQSELKSFSHYYALILFPIIKNFYPKQKHVGLRFLFGLMALIGLAFFGDFLAKYYNLPWSWPLAHYMCVSLLIFWSSWSIKKTSVILLGWAPFLINFFNFRIIRFIRGRIVHLSFLLTLIGVILTKISLFYSSFCDDLQLNGWVIHATYFGVVSVLSTFLPNSWSGLIIILNEQTSFNWWYNSLTDCFTGSRFFSYVVWLFNFQGFSFLTQTNALFISPGLGFFFIWALLKKSGK